MYNTGRQQKKWSNGIKWKWKYYPSWIKILAGGFLSLATQRILIDLQAASKIYMIVYVNNELEVEDVEMCIRCLKRI